MEGVDQLKGVGLGLRAPHVHYFLSKKPKIPWLEILADNYFAGGGIPMRQLEILRRDYPMTLHSVSLSLGSAEGINKSTLQELLLLKKRLRPVWISDHLCWSQLAERHYHDLLPVPYTEEALQLIVSHIQQVQDYLQQPLLVENVSSYMAYKESEMTEWHFLNAVAKHSGCKILLDINNIAVSAFNHGFDPYLYLQQIETQSVAQFHLAGYADKGTFRLDTHGEVVHEDVWQLFSAALQQFGTVPTLLEWDTDIPEIAVLMQEVWRAQGIMNSVNKDCHSTHVQ